MLLNVYIFGMKMYASQQVMVQIWLQEEVWLDGRYTFSIQKSYTFRNSDGIAVIISFNLI